MKSCDRGQTSIRNRNIYSKNLLNLEWEFKEFLRSSKQEEIPKKKNILHTAFHPFEVDNLDGLNGRLNLDNIKHCQQDLNTVSKLEKTVEKNHHGCNTKTSTNRSVEFILNSRVAVSHREANLRDDLRAEHISYVFGWSFETRSCDLNNLFGHGVRPIGIMLLQGLLPIDFKIQYYFDNLYILLIQHNTTQHVKKHISCRQMLEQQLLNP